MDYTPMNYRVLGRTGLKISEVSLGGWLTYGNTVEKSVTRDVTRRALELGINHIDTADVYAQGECEKALGEVLEGVRRASYVLASKVFWPTGPGPNDKGLSRKHIHETIDVSLKRLRTDYLDIFYCHRYDPETPLAETVAAMEDLVSRGKTIAWGVSCWTSDQISQACSLATRHKPVVNQPPYNIFARQIEKDVFSTCAKEGLGVAVWSPLAQGVLTGKYLNELPAGSRAMNEKINKFMQKYFTPEIQRVVEKLAAIARGAGLTTSQLALGWCLRRSELTTVIVGSTNVGQLEETAKATALSKDVLEAVDRVVQDAPQVEAV